MTSTKVHTADPWRHNEPLEHNFEPDKSPDMVSPHLSSSCCPITSSDSSIFSCKEQWYIGDAKYDGNSRELRCAAEGKWTYADDVTAEFVKPFCAGQSSLFSPTS